MSKYSDNILKQIQGVDGIGSGIDTDLVRGEVLSKYGFKNKIINGDMSVTQRGRMFSFEDDGDYTADRWYTEIQDGKEYVRQEIVWSKDEGSWKDETDPFDDGSQHNLWQFDGDATDTNGNNDGTLNGDASFVDDYIPGIGAVKVLTLDGDGDYVSTDFKIDDSDKYTLSSWFKTDTKQNSACILGSRDSDGTSEYIRGTIELDSDILQLSMGDDSDVSYHKVNIPKYYNNTLHNIVIAIDGYNQTVYFDSKKIGTYTLDVSAGTSSDYTYSIGRLGEEDGNYFKGQIARTRVFLGKALTQDEVYKLYVEDEKYIQQKQLRSVITKDDTISKYQPFTYRFEGKDLIDYKDEKVTISFNVRSNQTGDFSLSLINQSTDDKQSYITKFNYGNDDNTFQKVNVTVPLSDFDKFIRDNEELGFELVIAGIGDETDTEGIQDGEYFYLKDTVKLSENDWIAVTDAQLEVGDIVTEFERKSYEANVVENNAPFNLGIGASGYKWVDETANRDAGVTYTNTTEKAIHVSVWTDAGNDNSAMSISSYVDDVKIQYQKIANADDNDYIMCSFIVSNGSTYKIDGYINIVSWFELK